jgi:hypothetical protein
MRCRGVPEPPLPNPAGRFVPGIGDREQGVGRVGGTAVSGQYS